MVQLYTHTHTHLFIFRFFSLIGYYKILSIVPWVFVFIFKFFIWRFQKCTKQSSYMLFTQLPLLLASYIIIVQWLKLRNKLICTSFKDSTYKWYHMIFVFLWLTSLSMTICRYIHVAATDIILFFFFYGWVVFSYGEGNGNPLQSSYLENPRDRGAWWAAVCGVTHDWSALAAAAVFSYIYIYLLYRTGNSSLSTL